MAVGKKKKGARTEMDDVEMYTVYKMYKEDANSTRRSEKYFMGVIDQDCSSRRKDYEL